MGSVRVIRGSEISDVRSAVSTGRWTRKVIDVDDRLAINIARNEPKAISGWHHHGDSVGCVYVLRGQVRIEWGPGGRDIAKLSTGDFYVLDPRTIHRESNPGPDDHVLIAFAMGTGRKFIEADGPAPDGGSTREAGALRVARGGDLAAGPETHGMARDVTEVSESVSIGRTRNAPRTISGWHHHGDHTTCVYDIRGRTRIEWGPGGRERAEVEAGDFYIIYPNTIHREGNPGTDDQMIAGFFIGRGTSVVNVDGPEGG
ncbi:MAG TPA: cupin domain-containing protein [Gemmatimonadaceae bacterium]